MPSTVKSLQKFLRESKKRGFVNKVTHELKEARAQTVRIHSNGDFYNAEYIRKWISIAKRCGSTTFYAYTRSWRCAEKLAALQDLAKLPNVYLWWSCDAETHMLDGRPPKVAGVRNAYMAVTDGEWIPGYIDLVFRVRRDTVEKYRDGRLVCPAENGIAYTLKMTCTDCKLCFKDRNVPRRARQRSRCLVHS